ncbi:hypothetical protein ES703_98782 [subsurface metagenome]
MADDELNQTEDQNSPGGEELAESRVIELEALVAQKDEELTQANSRVSELEQVVAKAVASYKAMVTQSNSEVPEELISGDTIDSVNESLMKAKTLIGKVKQGLEAEITSSKVPAGAPLRTPPDLSALSPREKIQYAIGGKK